MSSTLEMRLSWFGIESRVELIKSQVIPAPRAPGGHLFLVERLDHATRGNGPTGPIDARALQLRLQPAQAALFPKVHQFRFA
jgi:hypothetical protein